jgi:hypothetical protein
MNKEEIKHHINLMDYAYKDNVDFKQIGLKKISWVTNKETDTQGYVAINTDTIYIVWRGSSSVNDFLRDSNIRKVKFLKEGELVHVGFLNAFNSIKDYLDKVIDNSFKKIGGIDKIKNIVICGHSLGGALSTLTAYHFCEKYPELREKVQKISIGSPRVGNSTFSKNYNKLVPFTLRIVNDNDLVARIPKIGYKHVDCVLSLDGDGKVIKRTFKIFRHIYECFISDITGSAVKDHFCDNYINIVNKWDGNF